MKRLFIILALALSACRPSDDRAIEAVRNAGFTDVQVTGSAFLACGSGDYARGAEFRARRAGPAQAAGSIWQSPANEVNGVVCCGLLKRCTIRY
jgi:hypothetical protein